MKQLLGVCLVAGLALAGCKKQEEETGEAASKADKKAPSAAKTADKKTDDGAKTPDGDKPAADAANTPEKRLAFAKKCWEAMAAKKNDEAMKCYAESGEYHFVDHIPPMNMKTSAEFGQLIAMLNKGFSDWKATPQLVLVNGSTIATIWHETATNDGEMMGMPATNKKYGVYSAAVATFNAEGKIDSDRKWGDQMSVMAQLGMMPKEAAEHAAPLTESGWSETFELIAKDDETEKKNVELVKTYYGHTSKGDTKAALEMVTDDMAFHYVAGKEPPTKDKAAFAKGMQGWIGMTSERSFDFKNVWGAGDWVVAEAMQKEVTAIDFPGEKVKTKGKTVELSNLSFFQIKDGKIARQIIFTNGLQYPVQWGMIDPAKMMADHGGKKGHEGHDMKKGTPAKGAPATK